MVPMGVSGYSSLAGAGLDRMALPSHLPFDAVYASDLFGAARVQQLKRPAHVKIERPEFHRITLWSQGTHMFDVWSEGKRRADAIMPAGISAVATAYTDSEYWLGPHNGANFVFYINPRHFESTFQDDSEAGRIVELQNNLCTSDAFFGHMMQAYLAEYNSARGFSAIALQSIAMQIGVHLARHYSGFVSRRALALTSQSESHRIQRAKAFIEENLELPISLADIANEVQLSQYYFARCFKAAEGMTPYQYVIKQRLERARFLVCETRQPLAQLAFACGFASQQHLTDRFTKAFGLPPGLMRQMSQG